MSLFYHIDKQFAFYYNCGDFLLKKRIFANLDIIASAKINLSLDITGILENGYHSIDTVLQSVDIYDRISIEKSSCVSIDCDDIPMESNTAYIAAKYFFRKSGINGGCHIKIQKGIPFAAGMGGSSSDAAAVFYGLNSLYDNPFTEEELIKMSSKVGADVPFLVTGGLQRGKGFGEKLERLESGFHFTALAVKGRGFITAKDAYSLYDIIGGPHPNTEKVIEALQGGDMETFVSSTGNSLEAACFGICPASKKVKSIFEEDPNCLCSFLTGSGSAVIGFYKNDDTAEKAKELFSGRESHVIHDTSKSLIIL